MPDFEKPSAAANEDTYEEVPSPEEIAELEAETNELAQEATHLTEELQAVVDNPETTEEQLGFIEQKFAEIKDAWEYVDKSIFIATGLSITATSMGAFSLATYDLNTNEKQVFIGLTAMAAFLAATSLIGSIQSVMDRMSWKRAVSKRT